MKDLGSVSRQARDMDYIGLQGMGVDHLGKIRAPALFDAEGNAEAGPSVPAKPMVAEELDNSGESLDARVLTVDYNSIGERFKEWRAISNEVK